MVPLPGELTIGQALAEYAEEAGKQPAADVRRFLEWQASGQNRDLAGYLAHLQRQGRAKGTADKVRREVQAFYRYHGLKAPRAKGWHYDARKEGTHEAISASMVAAMVKAARESLAPHLQAMLCLSTVYGLRSGEIALVAPGQVDFDGGRLFVQTEKHGRPCWQWMPPEVAAVLRDWQGTDRERAQKGFGHCWAAVTDEEKPKQLGWHGMRRALVVGLRRAGVSDPAIGHFMRWAGGGERDAVGRMVDWYGDPSATVGEESEETAPPPEGTRGEDAAVWDRHPFLGLWR